MIIHHNIANQPDTLDKMTNSLLVNVDIPINSKRLVRISLYPCKIDLDNKSRVDSKFPWPFSKDDSRRPHLSHALCSCPIAVNRCTRFLYGEERGTFHGKPSQMRTMVLVYAHLQNWMMIIVRGKC